MAEVLNRLNLDGMRRTAIENLHVTLKFLGDIVDSELDDILGAMAMAAEGVSGFELQSQALRFLPARRRPRLVALAMSQPAELAKLYEQHEQAMLAAGFRAEGRRYTPHITLGRFRKPPRDLPELPAAPPTGFLVESIRLVESKLTPHGPEYSHLAETPLG
jgi:2'-5' RNA ligase